MPYRNTGLTVSAAVRAALVAAAAALALAPRSSAAQNPVEFGVDAGVSVRFGSPTLTAVQIPTHRLRIGFFPTARVSIEPAFGLNVLSGDGGSLTTFDFQLGLLFHAHANRAKPQVYIRPFACVSGASGVVSGTAFEAGAGLGVKIPLQERIGTRLEAGFGHDFASSGSSGNTLSLGIGLSFFTH